MSDTSVTTEAPLANSTEARSPTGEILDRSSTTALTPTPTITLTTPDPALSADTSKTTETPDGKTTLTEAKTPPATPVVPEKYADFKAPDGFALDTKALESATPIFKELGLSQEQAQKLVDFHTAQMIEAAKAPQATVDTMRADWRAKVSADTDIKAAVAGDKTGIDAVKVDIGRALGKLDPALAGEFKSAMDLTGAGDHPAFIKAIWKLSQFVGEGTHVAGKGPSPAGQTNPSAPARPSAAQALYPTLPSAR
jgi:hypothetical protein